MSDPRDMINALRRQAGHLDQLCERLLIQDPSDMRIEYPAEDARLLRAAAEYIDRTSRDREAAAEIARRNREVAALTGPRGE